MKKLLVILPNNLGDVIMALPVLEGLKEQDRQFHITFFVERGYEAGLVNNPYCDRIFLFDRKTVRDAARTAEWRKSTESLKAVTDELAVECFDRVINLSQHPYTSLVTTLVSAKETLGQQFLRAGNHALLDKWSQYLYAIPFSRHYNALHATDIYRKIAGVADQPVGESMVVSASERQKAADYLAGRGIDPHSRKLMVLQPGAAYQAKRWPIEHFAALGKQLIDNGYTIIVTGAPAEQQLAASLGAQLGSASAIVTAGQLSFRETIALLPFVSGCVTGDTAIMHAAAALDRTVYALFGPTSPVETGPYGAGHHVFCGRCPSRPCFCFDCKSRLCMKSILPGDVYAVMRGERGSSLGCDYYLTMRSPDTTVRLDPVVELGTPYYNPVGAMFTRRFADPAYRGETTADPESLAVLRRETELFIEATGRMEAALAEFIVKRDTGALRRFEAERAACGRLTGIGAFWTALLNLRLNSVSLLDPVAGVRKSLDECGRTKSEVSSAVSFVK